MHTMSDSDNIIALWVSPSGNDNWTGRLSDPNQGATNGPLQTLTRALDEVRNIRTQDLVNDIVIQVKEGWYYFSETLVVDHRHAGNPGRLMIRACDDESVVFSGGVSAKGWRPCEMLPTGIDAQLSGKIWQAPMPEGVDQFKVMYREGRRLNRARGDGFNPETQDVSGPQYQMLLNHAHAMQHFVFPEGTVRAWENLEDIEVLARPSFPWVMNILSLTAVDESAFKRRHVS